LPGPVCANRKLVATNCSNKIVVNFLISTVKKVCVELVLCWQNKTIKCFDRKL
jgi:hypothetical protein